MPKPLTLSPALLFKIPENRKTHTIANLRWIGRNIPLSSMQSNEIRKAIYEEEEKKKYSKKLLKDRIREIALKHCAEYPDIDSCGSQERMWAIEATLDGLRLAVSDWATLATNMSDAFDITIEEAWKIYGPNA